MFWYGKYSELSIFRLDKYLKKSLFNNYVTNYWSHSLMDCEHRQVMSNEKETQLAIEF